MRDRQEPENDSSLLSSFSGRTPNLQLIDGRHSRLVASLPQLDRKLASFRLLEHARNLPPISSSPQGLFYYVDSLTRLCRLILDPIPFSGHPRFLEEILGLLEKAAASIAAKRIDNLVSARTRVEIILSMELAARGRWAEAEQLIRRAGIDTSAADLELTSEPVDQAQKLRRIREILSQSPHGSKIKWPYHISYRPWPPHDSCIMTLVVDGEEIPAHLREAYLAVLSATITLRTRKHDSTPIVKMNDDRGEELPLGENLKALVHEAVPHALALLGPSAQVRVNRCQPEIGITLRRPMPTAEVRGRSLLLPLVLVLARELGEQLNLPAIITPDRTVVWTGDVDRHGNVKTVSSMVEKTERVIASAFSGMAFPIVDRASVERSAREGNGEGRLNQFPLEHIQDVVRHRGIASIQTRNLLTRGAFAIRRKIRPLGIGGVIAVGILLAGLALVIPRLSSWLDSAVVRARLTQDHEHVELLNSRDRTLRKFGIEYTSDKYPALADVDSDGIPEVLYGTGSEDPIPGVLFCLDSHGEELWRFRGGFQEGQPKPFDLPNTFNCKGAFACDLDHDGVNEIVVFYTHTPWFASQVLLLTPNGDHVSSFWNIGHCVPGVFGAGKPSVAFGDIDGDTYDEVLIPGTNNSCDKAILLVLDPRSISGVGYDCRNETTQATWQSYVLLPSYPGLEAAMGIRRLQANNVSIRSWDGEEVIEVEVRGDLPGRKKAVGVFTFLLNFDLEFVHFHYCDEFSVWALKALEEGKIDFDVRSPEFFATMQEIELIPGPQELLLPKATPE